MSDTPTEYEVFLLQRLGKMERERDALRDALTGLERTATHLYRAAAPHANYGVASNRFADADTNIQTAREALGKVNEGTGDE